MEWIGLEGKPADNYAEMTSPAREIHNDQLVSQACTAQCGLRPAVFYDSLGRRPYSSHQRNTCHRTAYCDRGIGVM